MQLTLDLEQRAWGRFPNLEEMRGLNLGTAVFYYVARERVAGRPDPVLKPPLTWEQSAYIDWHCHPSRLRPRR